MRKEIDRERDQEKKRRTYEGDGTPQLDNQVRVFAPPPHIGLVEMPLNVTHTRAMN